MRTKPAVRWNKQKLWASLLVEACSRFASGPWTVNYVRVQRRLVREFAAQFLTLAESRTGTVPSMIGHRLMGTSLLHTGDIDAKSRHFDRGDDALLIRLRRP